MSALTALQTYGSSDSEEADDEFVDSDSDCVSDPDDLSTEALISSLLDTCIAEAVKHSSSASTMRRPVKTIASSSSSEDSSDDSDTSTLPDTTSRRKPKKHHQCYDDFLPPIEKLSITASPSECLIIGFVQSVINDDLVVVQALPNVPTVDLDTVLFLDAGSTPLGKVCDVIGPVLQPSYCLRVDLEASKMAALKDSKVYFAPKKECTSYVFIEQLRRLKGSDASWRNDHELPAERVRDFSDDEEERVARSNGLVPDTSESESESEVNARKTNTNVFYRQHRRYNPRDFGPITWTSVRANQQRMPQGVRPNRPQIHCPMPQMNRPMPLVSRAMPPMHPSMPPPWFIHPPVQPPAQPFNPFSLPPPPIANQADKEDKKE